MIRRVLATNGRRSKTYQCSKKNVEIHSRGYGEDVLVVTVIHIVQDDSHGESNVWKDNGHHVQQKGSFHSEPRFDQYS